MRKGDRIKVKQPGLGRPGVRKLCRYAEVMEYSPSVAAVFVDMKVRDRELWAISSDEKCIPGLDIGKVRVAEEITFPQFRGWDIWCCDLHKDSLRICFIKGRGGHRG